MTTAAVMRWITGPSWDGRVLRERAEILDGASEAVTERDERGVAHEALGLGHVGQRVRDVATATRGMAALELAPEDRLEHVDHLVEARPIAAANVERLAARIGRL